MIYLVQHCQSEHHVSDLTGGWTDTGLTALGWTQAGTIARSLAEAGARALYTSDLRRARETAEVIGRALGLERVLEPELREHNNGVAAWRTLGR